MANAQAAWGFAKVGDGSQILWQKLRYNPESMDEPLQKTVSIDFTVGIGDGQFTATAVVPAGQTNLTQILPVLHSLQDSLIAGVVTQLSEAGVTVSCKAGCGACCRQLVPLSIFEAEALAAWIRTLPAARQQALAARFQTAMQALTDAGLIDRMAKEEDWLVAGFARQMGLDYFQQRIPCPFLEAESCSIHPIRPLICREFLVSSSPQACADPHNFQVVPILLPLYLSRILNGIGAEVEGNSRGWIPLPFLFAWMESNPHPGEAVSGEGPQVLYEFVRRIAKAECPWSDADLSPSAPEANTPDAEPADHAQ
jgi:Fe-S-cluster containining protein